MPKQRRLFVSVLNITMQPHTPEKYIELFYDVFYQKISYKYHGEKFGVISKIKDIQDKMKNLALFGEISIFTNINKDAPWFNFESLEEAEENDIKEIIIPDNLRPNLTKCFFVFDAKKHQMFFITKNGADMSFGGKCMEKFIYNLLNSERNIEKYGNIAVSLLPERNVLEKIFSYPHISKLSIILAPPNPDDLADEEAKLMEKLNAMKAKKMEQSYTAETRTTSLVIDDETRKLSQIASSNGYVTVSAKDFYGASVTDSTKEHPLVISRQYYNDDDVRDELISIAKEKN